MPAPAHRKDSTSGGGARARPFASGCATAVWLLTALLASGEPARGEDVVGVDAGARWRPDVVVVVVDTLRALGYVQ